MIGKSHFKAALIGAGTAVLLGVAPAGAAEIDDLKAKVEALEKQLATSVSVGGFVKGDFYLDNRNGLGGGFDPTSIGLDGAEGDDGSVGAFAEWSRFRLSTNTPTSYGALNTVIEGHFAGGKDGGLFGLRHAYGELGPVRAGQAWSIISEEDTFADTVDFNGPVGTVWTRKPQLRLSLDLGKGFVGQMAVEKSSGSDELPGFLAALRYRSGWGAVALAGSVERVDDDGQNVSAHAIHIGAHLNVTDATRVMAVLNMTSGLGLIWGGGPGTLVDASGDLKAQDTMGGFAGVSHGWSDSIRSGVYFGWAQTDTANGVTTATAAGSTDDDDVFTPHLRATRTLHANVIWSPVPQADIGLEVMHGWRENNPQVDPADATKGEATRVQIGVKYSF